MTTQIGESRTKKMLKANELVLQYLTGGSDVGYILSAGSADVKQLREPKL